jgi:hypothetical protein
VKGGVPGSQQLTGVHRRGRKLRGGGVDCASWDDTLGSPINDSAPGASIAAFDRESGGRENKEEKGGKSGLHMARWARGEAAGGHERSEDSDTTLLRCYASLWTEELRGESPKEDAKNDE